MYPSKEVFLKDFKREGQLTLNILQELTDESLAQAVSEQDRTLGEIAWHTIVSIGGFAKIAGITFEGVDYTTVAPETAKEMADAYELTFNNLLRAYEEQLTDENFKDAIDFFGTPSTKGVLLYAYNTHQIHHRGQMTVLMRQADLHVPALYGPSRDSDV